MDVKHLNEFIIDLQTKDFSEVIQQIKEQVLLRKDMSASDIEKITEFLKHLKEHGMNTVEKTTETIENVLKFI
jgi:flagellar motor component MotA